LVGEVKQHLWEVQWAERVGVERGRQEGREEGRQEERRELLQRLARNLLAKGLSKDEIAVSAGVSLEEVEAILDIASGGD
jgi:predicted transposase/invertase (TIGR01784 family)